MTRRDARVNDASPAKGKEKQAETSDTAATGKSEEFAEEDEGGLSFWVKLVNAMVVLYYYVMSNKFEQAMVDHRSRRQAITQLQDTDRRIAVAMSQFTGVLIISFFFLAFCFFLRFHIRILKT